MKSSKITDSEADFLALSECAAELSVPDLAKRLKRSERSVRHISQKLHDRGFMRKLTFIDVYPLGFGYANIYFSLGKSGAKLREELIAALIRSKRVSWLCELGGDFHFGLALMVRNQHEVKDFLHSLSKRFASLFHEKVHTYHLSLSMFPKKYLAPGKNLGDALSYGEISQRISFDELDGQILSLLSQDGGLSSRELGRKLGRSHTTIEYRLRALRDAGVIKGMWYKLGPESLGYQSFKLLLFTKGFDPSLSISLRNFAQKHLKIVDYIECIGAWDYELGIETKTPSEVSVVTQEIYDLFGDHITSVSVVPIFKVLKVSSFPQISA